MPKLEITFTPDEQWNDKWRSLILMTRVDGRPVTWVVSVVFLAAPHVKVPDGDQTIRLFSERRNKIEGAPRGKIENGQHSSPAEIILKSIVEAA